MNYFLLDKYKINTKNISLIKKKIIFLQKPKWFFLQKSEIILEQKIDSSTIKHKKGVTEYRKILKE